MGGREEDKTDSSPHPFVSDLRLLLLRAGRRGGVGQAVSCGLECVIGAPHYPPGGGWWGVMITGRLDRVQRSTTLVQSRCDTSLGRRRTSVEPRNQIHFLQCVIDGGAPECVISRQCGPSVGRNIHDSFGIFTFFEYSTRD